VGFLDYLYQAVFSRKSGFEASKMRVNKKATGFKLWLF